MKLREVTLDDAKFLFEMKQDKEFQKTYPSRLIPINLDEQIKETKEDLRSAKRELGHVFIIEEKNQKIGFMDVYKINKKHNRCALGFGIAKEFWGKGYATKAVSLVIKKIKKLGLHGVEATAHPNNKASQKVMEKNGFVKVGLMKDYYYSNNKYVDRILYWKVL